MGVIDWILGAFLIVATLVFISLGVFIWIEIIL
jgi:hypothetical protein